MNYTPGEWTIKYEFNVFGGNNRLVASCGGHSSNVNSEKVHYENIANANLTAAAPDRYEAIIRLKQWYENGTRTGKTLSDVISPLFDAIAKAEGRKDDG